MTWWGSPRALGTRVTLWNTSALVLALLAYAVVVLVSVRVVIWAELDDRLHHEIETVEGLLQPYWTPDGPRTPDGASPLDDDDYRWLQVWSEGGRLLFESDVARAQPIVGLAVPAEDASVSVVRQDGARLRVKTERGHVARHPVIVRVATSEDRVRAELTELFAFMAAALFLCAAGAGYGVHRLSRRAVAPIGRLVDAANSITAADLAARLPIETPHDEVGQLAQAFNATLARLDASFTQMQRFTANASHELRTPLTALQTAGEGALTDAHSVEEHRDAIGSMLEEAKHLSNLIETLLLLARSDAGQIRLELQPIDLLAVIGEVVAECAVLADEKAQHIDFGGEPAALAADATVLRIALANVLHNAIRYSPIGGSIRVVVTKATTTVQIDVVDSGRGIPAEHLPLVFERFYRSDAGRTLAAGGVGLGLAMARWAVGAHGGTISARNNADAGCTFSIVLPLPPRS